MDYGDEIKEHKRYMQECKDLEKGWFCLDCDYEWESRKNYGTPSICPNCKSKNIKNYSNTKEWLEEFIEENPVPIKRGLRKFKCFLCKKMLFIEIDNTREVEMGFCADCPHCKKEINLNMENLIIK